MQKRTFLSTLAMLAGAQFAFGAQRVMETQLGDPDLPSEHLEFDDDVLGLGLVRAIYEPRITDFSEHMIEGCQPWLKFSRQESNVEISKLLSPFRLYEDAPFCAAGLSYVAASVYASKYAHQVDISTITTYFGEVDKYHFMPSASVTSIKLAAQAHNRWLPAAESGGIKRGSLVIFDWNGAGQTHVGLVTGTDGPELLTIEFNTSIEGAKGSQRTGGHIAERRRAKNLKAIQGYVRT